MAQEVEFRTALNNVTEERPKPYVARQIDQASRCLRGAPRGADRLFNHFRPKSHAGAKFIRHPNAEPDGFAGPPGFRQAV